MRNLFPGNCLSCGKLVPKGQGHPHIDYSKGYKRWLVHCVKCVQEKREQKQKKGEKRAKKVNTQQITKGE